MVPGTVHCRSSLPATELLSIPSKKRQSKPKGKRVLREGVDGRRQRLVMSLFDVPGGADIDHSAVRRMNGGIEIGKVIPTQC